MPLPEGPYFHDTTKASLKENYDIGVIRSKDDRVIARKILSQLESGNGSNLERS